MTGGFVLLRSISADGCSQLAPLLSTNMDDEEHQHNDEGERLSNGYTNGLHFIHAARGRDMQQVDATLLTKCVAIPAHMEPVTLSSMQY